MAKIRKNAVVQGASGKFGDLIVFRQLPDGTTIMTQAPGKNPNRRPTEKQKKVKRNFQMATIYGKGAVASPETKALYESGKGGSVRSAYQAAVADFLRAPSIEQVDVSGYTGEPGDTIEIIATDDFMVKEVEVVIYNADGSEVDKSMAMQDPANELKWIWTASAQNDNTTGDKIVVMASDLPGRIAEMEQELA